VQPLANLPAPQLSVFVLCISKAGGLSTVGYAPAAVANKIFEPKKEGKFFSPVSLSFATKWLSLLYLGTNGLRQESVLNTQ
jgi:hypothetical protein